MVSPLAIFDLLSGGAAQGLVTQVQALVQTQTG